MIPKLDIQSRFVEQQDDILQALQADLELPINNIEITSVDRSNYIGVISAEIGEKKVLIPFRYQNQQFFWHKEGLIAQAQNIWSYIYDFYSADIMGLIEQKQSVLGIEFGSLKKVTAGKIPTVYLHQGDLKVVAINIAFKDSEWTVAKVATN